MELDIQLSRGDLVLKAKDETYLAVRTHLVSEQSNANARYEMQADERQTHERKLLGSIPSALARLKAVLFRYTVTDTLTDTQDDFEVSLIVPDRFHQERQEDVKRIVSQYIYRTMVSEWWEANYPKCAETYKTSTAECEIRLQMLLSQSYPAVTHVRNTTATLSPDKRHIFVDTTLCLEEIMDDVHSEILSVSLASANDKGIPNLAMQTDEILGASQLERSIKRHASRIEGRMAAYIAEPPETKPDISEQWLDPIRYCLNMPATWDARQKGRIADELQNYIVLHTVGDYLSLYNANTGLSYTQRAEEAGDEIKYILTMRKPGTYRRPLQPF
jgi:hypothetical protein